MKPLQNQFDIKLSTPQSHQPPGSTLLLQSAEVKQYKYHWYLVVQKLSINYLDKPVVQKLSINYPDKPGIANYMDQQRGAGPKQKQNLMEELRYIQHEHTDLTRTQSQLINIASSTVEGTMRN
jgi:uncharacterized lipoprotein YmbA